MLPSAVSNLSRQHLILGLYLSLWITYYLLVHSSRRQEEEHEKEKGVRSPAVLILVVEAIKLTVSSALYVFYRQSGVTLDRNHAEVVKSEVRQGSAFPALLKAYLPIAILYAVYNNLMIVNLRFFANPTVYLVLSSGRVLITSVLWQWVFGIKITQWKSLCILTVGVLIMALSSAESSDENGETEDNPTVFTTTTTTSAGLGNYLGYYLNYTAAYTWHLCLVLTQMCCSAAASVYNEKVLKTRKGGASARSLHLHNVCLYFDSILLNGFMAVMPHVFSPTNPAGIRGLWTINTIQESLLFSPVEIVIILTLAAVGIVTSMLLRYVDSVSKSVAAATEPAITAVVGFLIFGYHITAGMAFSSVLVFVGAVTYSQPDNDWFGKTLHQTSQAVKNISLHGNIKHFLTYLCLSHLLVKHFMVAFHITVDELLHIPQGSEPYTGHQPEMYPTNQVGQLSKLYDMPSCESPEAADEFDKNGTKWEVYATAVEVFDSVNADYFAHAGNLLGFVRECRHFDGDLDFLVDLDWMLANNNSENLRQAFLDKGYKYNKAFSGFNGTALSLGGQQWVTTGGRGLIDLFFGVKRHGYIWTGINDGRKFLCPKPFTGVEKFRYGNITVRVPMPYHDFLLTMYGDDYMVPQRGMRFQQKAKLKITTGQCLVAPRHTIRSENEYIKKGRSKKRRGRGYVTCITEDPVSVSHGLALVERLSQLAIPPMLEVYHNGTLSYFMKSQLSRHEFVTVIDLWMDLEEDLTNSASSGRDSIAAMYRAAVIKTRLRHVFLVRPSIVFIQDPLQLVRHIEFQHDYETKDTSCMVEVPRGKSKEPKYRMVEGAVCVTVTDFDLAEAIEPLRLQNSSAGLCVLHVAHNDSIPGIHSKTTGEQLALVHEGAHRIGLWAYPAIIDPLLISHYLETDFVLSTTKNGPGYLPELYSESLRTSWRCFLNATNTVAMDRNIDWVAFDGGFHFEVATLNSVPATERSIQRGATAVNIDLALTADRKLIAIHNDKMFLPFEVKGSRLNKAISSMTLLEATDKQNSTNPCVPQLFASEWLDDNHYSNYKCQHSKIAFNDDFLSYFPDTDFIFDLKAPTIELQLEQARILVALDAKGGNPKSRVRFFDASKDGSLAASIIPDLALQALASDESLRQVHFYANVPSALACTQLMAWVKYSPIFLNKNIAGCFVLLEHARIAENWKAFVSANKVSLGKLWTGATSRAMICDVARKQSEADTRLWTDGFALCHISGFDTVHHPFAFPPKATMDIPPSYCSLSTFEDSVFQSVGSSLSEKMTDDNWRRYASHWGIQISQSDWSCRGDRWFRGDIAVSKVPPEGNENVIFRCVTKILTVMFFLRLEELALINLDDPIPDTSMGKTITWRHIFANTADVDKPRKSSMRPIPNTDDLAQPGETFVYSNRLWGNVGAVVQDITGMDFSTAMQYYILDPMGIVGSFDTDTQYPPFAARGFIGPLDDLLLIGSTLAARGVSQKTRKRVIMASSVDSLLRNTVVGEVEHTFSNNIVVKSMSRFVGSSGTKFPHGVVDGYGLGLWRVNGWRLTPNGSPIRGWLSMGSSEALLYFDMTGVVVAMHSTRKLKYELTGNFARMVASLSDHIFDQQGLRPLAGDNSTGIPKSLQRPR